jgi:acyl-CoA thioesterase YciA
MASCYISDGKNQEILERYAVTEQPVVTLPNRQPTIRVAAMPSDANYTGDIFGGWLMGQVDIAGSIPAVNRAKGRVATVAVNSFVFKQPLFVGDIVSFYADIIKVGNTSITVDVEVYVQRNPAKPECFKVTEATLTYVAVDENRKPRVVPPEK